MKTRIGVLLVVSAAMAIPLGASSAEAGKCKPGGPCAGPGPTNPDVDPNACTATDRSRNTVEIYKLKRVTCAKAQEVWLNYSASPTGTGKWKCIGLPDEKGSCTKGKKPKKKKFKFRAV